MWKLWPNVNQCFLGVFVVLFCCVLFAPKLYFNKLFESNMKRLRQDQEDESLKVRPVSNLFESVVKQLSQDQEDHSLEVTRVLNLSGQKMEMIKQEMKKELNMVKNKRNKKDAVNHREKLQWYNDALKRWDNFQDGILKLKALTAQNIADQRKLWGGRNPVEVFNKWQGIILDGDLPLRRFAGVNEADSEKEKQLEKEMSDKEVEERFFQLMSQIHVHCFLQKRMGYYKDGGWDMCLSDPYRPKKDNCLVYSFGINNDFSFDDDIDKTFGCKVKSYDPSMSVKTHARSKNVYFYKIGLGGKDEVNEDNWQLKTFSTILKENDHLDTVIDYVKIDIEGSEIPSLKQMMANQGLKNVKQLSFEIHLYDRYTPDLLYYYSLLYDLEKLGFRRYFYHINSHCMYKSPLTEFKRSFCHEMYYININFL